MVETVILTEEPDTPTNFSGTVDLPDTNTLYILKVNLYYDDSFKNDVPEADGTVTNGHER